MWPYACQRSLTCASNRAFGLLFIAGQLHLYVIGLFGKFEQNSLCDILPIFLRNCYSVDLFAPEACEKCES